MPVRQVATRRAATAPRARRPSDEMQPAILEATRRLYASGGYGAVTMRALASELGVQPSSLYHHFTSKEQIFRTIQEQTLAVLLERAHALPATADPLADLRAYFWGYYEFAQEQPDNFAILYVDRATPPFDVGIDSASVMIQALAEETRRLVKRCVDAKLFPRGMNPNYVGQILWICIHGAAAMKLTHGAHLPDSDRVAAATLDLALEGIRAGRVGAPPKRSRYVRRARK